MPVKLSGSRNGSGGAAPVAILHPEHKFEAVDGGGTANIEAVCIYAITALKRSNVMRANSRIPSTGNKRYSWYAVCVRSKKTSFGKCIPGVPLISGTWNPGIGSHYVAALQSGD